MELHLRANSANGTHVRFTVFMNEANCGQLTMKEDEAIFFRERLLRFDPKSIHDEVYYSGNWTKEVEDDLSS